MRVFFDTEFYEDGKVIDLLSIGLVREDGDELYLVSSDFDVPRARTSIWLVDNVLPHIPDDFPRHPRSHIAELIVNWLWDVPKPEFWAYYADYDWIALCQLYGRMIDLPKGWPMYCRDLKQRADELDLTLPPHSGVEHHALADARWVKQAFDFCQPL